MPFIHDDVLDGGLTLLTGANRRLDICHTEPATYAAATSTNTVGNKTGITVTLRRHVSATIVPTITLTKSQVLEVPATGMCSIGVGKVTVFPGVASQAQIEEAK